MKNKMLQFVDVKQETLKEELIKERTTGNLQDYIKQGN